jgi:hypothetical protein
LDDSSRRQGGKEIFGIWQTEKSQKAPELPKCDEKHQLQKQNPESRITPSPKELSGNTEIKADG